MRRNERKAWREMIGKELRTFKFFFKTQGTEFEQKINVF